jgi:hypothetical protein
LLGLGLALVLVARSWPATTTVVLRLEGARQGVARLEMRVHGAGGEEEVNAAWAFDRGAPPSVRTAVRLPRGRWGLTLQAERRGGGVERFEREVTLGGDEIQVPLRFEGDP